MQFLNIDRIHNGLEIAFGGTVGVLFIAGKNNAATVCCSYSNKIRIIVYMSPHGKILTNINAAYQQSRYLVTLADVISKQNAKGKHVYNMIPKKFVILFGYQNHEIFF